MIFLLYSHRLVLPLRWFKRLFYFILSPVGFAGGFLTLGAGYLDGR